MNTLIANIWGTLYFFKYLWFGNWILTNLPAFRLCFSSFLKGDREVALLVSNFLDVIIPNCTPYEQPPHSQFCFNSSRPLHEQSGSHPWEQAVATPHAAPADESAQRYADSRVPDQKYYYDNEIFVIFSIFWLSFSDFVYF